MAAEPQRGAPACLGTRGGPPATLQQAVVQCMAPQGGLYVPSHWPQADAEALREPFAAGDYPAFAAALLAPWFQGWIQPPQLLELCRSAWGPPFFPQGQNPAPLRRLDEGLWVLELHLGPTAAFKDFGLSLLRRLFVLGLRPGSNARATVVMATSGDTGAAAVASFAGARDIDLVVLFPQDGVSPAQRRQMLCSGAANVRCLQVQGDFDDCQALVKRALREGVGPRRTLLGVNSVNIGRLLAQMVYYHWAAWQLPEGAGAPSFAVPSGNLGNALSCWMAARCGLPLHALVLACNSNDGLARLVRESRYQYRATQRTHASAMDISVPSNLERLLFEFAGRDPVRLGELQRGFPDRPLQLSPQEWQGFAQTPILAGSCTDAQILETVRESVAQYPGWQPDPHTAVGLRVLRELQDGGGLDGGPLVLVSTAHPGKFPEVSRLAGAPVCQLPRETPDAEERVETLASDYESFAAHLAA